PAYEPSGQGDHLYLLARDGVPGLKDRHAVTRQQVSVPVSAEPRLAQLDGDGIRVLRVSRHTNKLRPGHLRGNRFRVLVRDATQTPALDTVLERIRTHGLPNYYGPQRFGRGGETSTLGLAMLRGAATRRPGFFLRK